MFERRRKKERGERRKGEGNKMSEREGEERKEGDGENGEKERKKKGGKGYTESGTKAEKEEMGEEKKGKRMKGTKEETWNRKCRGGRQGEGRRDGDREIGKEKERVGGLKRPRRGGEGIQVRRKNLSSHVHRFRRFQIFHITRKKSENVFKHFSLCHRLSTSASFSLTFSVSLFLSLSVSVSV